jgi:hypothetical protein
MKLIIWFSGLCTFLNERLDFLQLTLVSGLKPRRIVEDEHRIALKGKWAIDIMDPALINSQIKLSS